MDTEKKAYNSTTSKLQVKRIA